MPARLVCLTSALALGAAIPAHAEMNFNRIASFATPHNMAAGEDQARKTSAEIVAASADGLTLIYTDSPLGVVGLIDITDPTNPKPSGNIDMGGEPTSVTVIGDTAFVAVNTSESYAAPSGHLTTVDLKTGKILGTCDLGGQPDSTAKAHDGSFISIAVENERDEDAGDGRVPQMPAGYVVLLDVTKGAVACDSQKRVDLTGLAAIAPEDPEPEFVDINGLGETVVTLQENNHIAVLGKDGKVLSHFSAGSVDLTGIDATDEKAALIFTESQPGRLREPDMVQWLDDTRFAIANEGDMDGGTRGWTVFAKDGTQIYDSGLSFEQAVIRIGHYPDRRSDAKGVEPEGLEYATFGTTPYLFVLAERASVVGVYDMTTPAAPKLAQLLPSGMAPEGSLAIPARNLFITANESDLGEDGGARSHVMIYQYQDAPAAYPTITSQGADSLIGWGAISGMVADADVPGKLYAVNDSFYSFQPRIYTIDATQTPARITKALDITRGGRPAQKLDLEGITLDGDGGFWAASEGNDDKLTPHGLYHIDARGRIRDEVPIPADLRGVETRYGFEGLTRIGETLWMPVQREWEDDAKHTVKLLAYNTKSKEWGAVRYAKEKPADKGWVGLSEMTAHGDWVYIIERDNQIGEAAAIKKVYRVAASDLVPAPIGSDLPVVKKELVRDLIPDLAAWKGYVVDKVESLAIDAKGEIFVATDNDGVDDSSGETFFWSIGTAN